MDAQQSRISTATRIVRRPQGATPRHVSADICVLGAGIAGISAALEAARLGRNVVIVDGLPALGGLAVNSIIGVAQIDVDALRRRVRDNIERVD